MTRIGNYYKEQKDYPNMLKYYLMAIENGCATAKINLENYYKNDNIRSEQNRNLLVW